MAKLPLSPRRLIKAMPWIAGILFILFMLVCTVPFIWLDRREDKLERFCDAVQVNMSFAQMLELEEQIGIDDSYPSLIPHDEVFKHQDQYPELAFRCFQLDPISECVISHNGKTVTSVQLLR